MSKRVEGLTVEIGANTSEFNENMRVCRKYTKQFSVELKELNRDLRLNPKSIETINKKIDTLKDSLSIAKRKQEELNAQMRRMEQAGKVDTTSYLNLKSQLITARNEVDKFTKDIDKLNKRKIALNVSNDSMRKVSKEFKNIDMNAEGAEEKVKILQMRIAELTNYSANRLNKVSQNFKNIGTKISDAGRSTTPLTMGILGAGAAAVKFGADMQDTEQATNAVFGAKITKQIESFGNKSAASFGISKQSAMQATTSYGNMWTSMGLGKQKSAELSMKMVQLAADASSFTGVPVEESVNAMTGALSGETEALKTLGVMMTDNQVKLYAQKNGFKGNWQEADNLTKAQYRLKYIQTQLKNANGDFKRSSDSMQNTLKTLKANFSNLATTLGNALIPVLQPIIAKFNALLVKFQQMTPAQQQMIIKIAAITAVIPPLLIAIGKISVGVSALIKVFTLVKLPLMNFRGLLMKNIATSGLFKGALSSLKVAFTAFTSPVGLVVGAIAGLVAAFVLAYNKCKWFRQIVDNLVKFFVDSFKPILNDISTFIKTTVTPAFKSIGDWCKKHVSPILKKLGNLMKTHLKTAFIVLSSKIKMVIAVFRSMWDIVKIVGQILTGDFSGATKTAKNMLSYLKGAVQNVWNEMKKTWIVKTLTKVFGNLKSMANKVWNKLRETGAIKVLKGAFDGLGKVVNSIIDAFNGMKNAVSRAFNFISDKIGSIGKKISSIDLNPFDAGGFGNFNVVHSLANNSFNAGGFGNNGIVLNANFTLNSNEQKIDENTFRGFGKTFIQYVDEELGKAMGW